MRTGKRIALLLSLVPLAVTLLVLPLLPSEIPAHYNSQGEADRFGSRFELLILPAFTILMHFFWVLMAKVVQKDKDKAVQNTKVLFLGDCIMTLTFTVLQVWFLHLAYTQALELNGSGFDFPKILAILLCLAWIVLGNAFPKCKQNSLVGIRTKWTLASEDNWYQTHRFGGRVYVAGGLVLLACCLFVPGSLGLWLALGGMLLFVVLIVLYSFFLHRKAAGGDTT